MALVTRARAAGILAISLLMLGAPGASAGLELYFPDAQIRLASDLAYEGVGFANLDAASQSVIEAGVVGDKLTFWIKIVNAGQLPDSFKVKRSSGYTNGYRVRYYNAAGRDVTWPVTKGTFTTPSLVPGSDYVMRATVKIRSLATQGSFTSRLITVSSVHVASAKDTVRFSASLANSPPVANLDTNIATTNAAHPLGNVLTNDSDANGDPLTVTSVGTFILNYGSLVINVDGSYSYTLNIHHPEVEVLLVGEQLPDSFTYSIIDGHGGTDSAQLQITIHGIIVVVTPP